MHTRALGVVVAGLCACTSTSDRTDVSDVQQAVTPRTYKVAIVMLQLSDDTSQPNTVAQARDIAFTGQYSARAFFLEWSFGNLSLEGTSGPTGDIFGWYPIAASGASCNLAAYEQQGNAAALANDGVDLTATYDSIVYTWNNTACGGGSAALPGQRIFLSPGNFTGYAGALAHELGHNLGLQHSGSLACTDAGGNPVPLSNTCVPTEYGDSFDIMGPDAPRMTAFHKERLGFFDPANKLTVTTDGDYTIAPLEQASTDVQGLRIHRRNDPTHDLYLDFRQPFGLDNFFPDDPAVNGVMIRIVPVDATQHQSVLLDMTPSTPAVGDATLLLNETFDDNAGGVHITTTAVAPTGVTVHVTIDPPLPPDAGVPDAPPMLDAPLPPDAPAIDAPPVDGATDASVIDAPAVDAAGPDADDPGDGDGNDQTSDDVADDGVDGGNSDDDDGGCCSASPQLRIEWLGLVVALGAVLRRRRRR